MLDATASRFRPFEVVSKVRESTTITSFRLTPLERHHWQSFEPGQFLTIRVPDGKGGHVLRNYTVSSSPREEGTYRITVKREAAPAQGVPEGLAPAGYTTRSSPAPLSRSTRHAVHSNSTAGVPAPSFSSLVASD